MINQGCQCYSLSDTLLTVLLMADGSGWFNTVSFPTEIYYIAVATVILTTIISNSDEKRCCLLYRIMI